ncbi:multiple sugar transport system substrate-binding protein [Mycetocola sp. BIGb0189]|uniref:ABC transporter substrate-binding protein n=1 Tax=Mycetocola sp. BIGb0189 TaxID=2940604 RepID=UPI00216715F1|nr:sugar ABC transporter substrate-binding protein [Mycetocola sp. BIGb0189]MCS4276540.1 multiple sugar transport system substrate-binding protein [Mycetocola sp. BIGb0189]
MSIFSTPRRRLAGAVAGLSIAALALSGCSASADADDNSQAGDKSLTVLLISSHKGAAEWLKTEYQKETGVKINPVIVPYDEIGSKLALDQQSGANTIDAAAPWYVSLGSLAQDGAIKDLTGVIKDRADEIKPDDFIPSIYDPYSLVDGKRYGLPFDGDTHVLFYNKEILARNNITEPPATWDEYLEDVKTITANEGKSGTYGAAVFGQKSPLILGASFANRLAGFGGEFLDKDGKPVINSPEAVKAAQALVDVNNFALPTPAETDFGAGNNAWYSGKVGFIENWTDTGVNSENTAGDSKVAGKWGVTFLPTEKAGEKSRASLVAGFSWVVAANTKKTKLAEDFIIWASSEKVNAALLTAIPTTGIDPNRKSSLEDATYGEKYPEIQRVNRATLDGALAWPTGPKATELAQTLTDELAKLLAGTGGTAKETLDRVQTKWESLLGK